jgi:thioredoxin reductase (NADPH)
MGTTPCSTLADELGAALGPDRRLYVDDHMMTSIPGLYAAGDLVRGLNQISIAQGEAAIAATAIHNGLRSGILPAPMERPVDGGFKAPVAA